MALYDRLADQAVRIDNYDLELYEHETSSEFARTTSVVHLHGDGETGSGEDVTYEPEAHPAVVNGSMDLPLDGEYTHQTFSDHLDRLDLFPNYDSEREDSQHYRRWAFESAALDLALKQAETNLADALDREYDPLEFIVSTRLGDPPSADRIHTWLAMIPSLEFKLDPTSAWTDELVAELAATDAVRIVDLKGRYHGTPVDQPADPDLYERIIEAFPEAYIEDPAFTDETRALFDGHEQRITWDYPVTGIESIEALPFEPDCLNIKPSRFSTVESILDSIEYCLDSGIRMYGGGQTELSVGREHIHAIASLFYPDAPNDIAPRGFNDPEPRAGCPESPLHPHGDLRGFEWA
jgi:hypothetical protein